MIQDSSKIVVISAPPMDSLKELRRQNSVLLHRNIRGDGVSKPTAGELLGFLEAASKLGASLEHPDERETAQGIMDVWIAVLLNLDPEAGNVSRPFSLEPLDECSAHLQTTEVQQLRVEAVQAARRAEDILPTSQEVPVKQVRISCLHDWMPRFLKPWFMQLAGRDSDVSVMQRLLLRFIRLKEKSTDAYPIPVADSDDIFREPKARGLLEQLINAGVVKKQETTPDAAPSYMLTHESLLTKWSFLVDIIIQRRSFRQLARGWDNGGRQTSALLSGGEQLQQALDYPHTDELEDAFIEASRRSGERFRTIVLTLFSVALMVLSFMVWRLDAANTSLNKANADLKTRSDEVALQKKQIEVANRELQQSLALTKTEGSKYLSLKEQLASLVKLPELASAPTIKKRADEILTRLTPSPALISTEGSTAQASSTYTPKKHSIEDFRKLALTKPAADARIKPMVEVFVSLNVLFGEKGTSYEKALQFGVALKEKGFQHSSGTLLPRTASGTLLRTEIRFYHKEDMDLVLLAYDTLIAAGISSEYTTSAGKKTQGIIIEDHSNKEHTDSPKRFLQIAIADKDVAAPASRPTQ